MPNFANVFELEENPVVFSSLQIGRIFMVVEEQVNHYWRTPIHDWQPYLSSIVYRKESEKTVQRLMTQFPSPLESVADENLIIYPVRFIGRVSQQSYGQQ